MLELISNLFLPVMILIIFTVAIIKKIPIYEEFIDGAKDGFKISISIIPYLVALIVAISMLRASGVFEMISSSISRLNLLQFIPADVLPIIFTRSLSGSATLGVFSEIVANNGPDCFTTMLAAIMVGSSETTFYVLSVYFGSIGVKKFKYAILNGILADIIGILLAIFVARMFFLANTGL